MFGKCETSENNLGILGDHLAFLTHELISTIFFGGFECLKEDGSKRGW